jgi:hypothetical protein
VPTDPLTLPAYKISRIVPDIELIRHTVYIRLARDANHPCEEQRDPNVECSVIKLLDSTGMGTVINEGTSILTHHHYSSSWDDIDYLYIKDHLGTEMWLEESELEFSYRRFSNDEIGSEVIQLPVDKNLLTELDVTSANLGSSSMNYVGYVIQAVRQDFSVMRATVYDEDTNIKEKVLHFSDSRNLIIGGDSGGGVYKDGLLIGNVWSYNETSSGERSGTANAAVIPFDLQ